MLSAESCRIPVIIPAHNEEAVIARTLSALPASLVEPVVAVNGSTDRTAEIASDFGVTVLDLPEQGKLPAVQTTLRKLGTRSLEPVLILDADTYPVFPKRWASGMAGRLRIPDDERPVGIGGPVWYTGGDTLNATLRSLRKYVRAFETRRIQDPDIFGQCGPNMGIHLKSHELLEEVLSLPHYWPSEDIALAHKITGAGGVYHQPLDPSMLTISPASVSFLSLSETRKLGINDARRKMMALYAERGAPGSVPYTRNTA